MEPERRRCEPSGVEVPAGAHDQLLMGADAFPASEDRGDALLGSHRLVVALQEPAAVSLRELSGALPAPVGDLLAGAVAEADRNGARGVDVGDGRVAGGRAVRVQGSVEPAGRLRRQRAREIAVLAHLLEPGIRRGLVGEGPRPDHGHSRQRDRGRIGSGGDVLRLAGAAGAGRLTGARQASSAPGRRDRNRAHPRAAAGSGHRQGPACPGGRVARRGGGGAERDCSATRRCGRCSNARPSRPAGRRRKASSGPWADRARRSGRGACPTDSGRAGPPPAASRRWWRQA